MKSLLCIMALASCVPAFALTLDCHGPSGDHAVRLKIEINDDQVATAVAAEVDGAPVLSLEAGQLRTNVASFPLEGGGSIDAYMVDGWSETGSVAAMLSFDEATSTGSGGAGLVTKDLTTGPMIVDCVIAGEE